MTVVTRFAPSPTGFLHIGGARTALFNWLYARHQGGQFRLRIEDTDRARSTPEAVAAIIDGLTWLELQWDGEVVHQFDRAPRHNELAQKLLDAEKAYRCYCTPEELAEMREKARAEGRPARYDGRWRERDPSAAPPGIEPAVRFKAPQEGATVIEDLVQGSVRTANEQLDDMVLLRADGTPTYMLSVVVDDHDMGVTHAIRGDDHLTNAFRQTQLFRALGWQPPRYAHIPLLHGPDGAKLSKRHGALALSAYREMGILAEAMRNYLLRLGWSHGDDEIISTEQAIAWFDLEGVGRSPARFDMEKLLSVNAHYLRHSPDARLVELAAPELAARLGRALDAEQTERLERGMAGLKERAKTVLELAENAYFYVADRPLTPDSKGAKLLSDREARANLAELANALERLDDWSESALEDAVRAFAEAKGLKLGGIAQPLRAALTGSTTSPGIFEILLILGRDEALARIGDAVRGP
ncbi:MAG: glutamate--tRNA ligase [Proteobacteria bacterium]|nr:glutamate--tRNA ligase [Pseudomonadota bacterium]